MVQVKLNQPCLTHSLHTPYDEPNLKGHFHHAELKVDERLNPR